MGARVPDIKDMIVKEYKRVRRHISFGDEGSVMHTLIERKKIVGFSYDDYDKHHLDGSIPQVLRDLLVLARETKKQLHYYHSAGEATVCEIFKHDGTLMDVRIS